MFLRVRSAHPGDPLHEFDVHADELERNPHLYTVVDPVPVPRPRSPIFRDGLVPPPAHVRRPRRAPSTDLVRIRTAPVGDDS